MLGQIVSIQSRYVADEDIPEFIHRETTYWSEVAKQAILERRLVRWELWRGQSSAGLGREANFFFLNEFRRPEDVDQMDKIWDYTRVFPDVNRSDIDTSSLSKVIDQVFLYSQVNIGVSQPNIVRVNYAKAIDLGRYLELENTVWQSFVQERMDAEETNVVSWELLSVMSPGGVNRPYDALTIDGFASLSDALQTSYGANAVYPDLESFRKVHTKVITRIYSLVKSVNLTQ